VVAEAERSHPLLVVDDLLADSASYLAAGDDASGLLGPLPDHHPEARCDGGDPIGTDRKPDAWRGAADLRVSCGERGDADHLTLKVHRRAPAVARVDGH
jgi:hypothetical protein